MKEWFNSLSTTKGWSLVVKAFSALMVFFQLLGSAIFGTPHEPYGKTIDLNDFTLTWSDEFNGNSIDTAKWKDHYGGGETAVIRKGGYTHYSLAEVKDGNLYINAKYLESGTGGGPAGYYSYLMDTNGLFEQKYGYFEVRCILPKGEGLWAAFWMLTDSMWQEDGTGIDGAEIDIFESPNYFKDGDLHNSVSSNIHIDGYGDAHQSSGIGDVIADNPYEEYNTYGLEWNEDEYIFYINGVETDRTSFGGVSQVPEYLILSVEIGGANGTPENSWAGDIRNNDCLPSAFVVDYVRAYQYNKLAIS